MILCNLAIAQINTFSPYSRFGLGELNQNTFAHNQAMAGTCIALKPDSLFPIMINTGNPASYSLIKFATFEVGGNFKTSYFSSNTAAQVTKWTTNFNYGTLGFPIRSRGGAAFGIMPYTNVGYNMQSKTDEPNIGNVSYNYAGEGGFNKVFVGYGLQPFKLSLAKFRTRQAKKITEGKAISKGSYKFKETVNELASDFSIGFNANYIFGSTVNYLDVRYPNSLLYYNTIRERTVRVNDFTGNFGIQTGFTKDSIRVRRKDTNNVTVGSYKRVLNEKIKFVFGYYMALNNSIKARYDLVSYNYYLNGNGSIVPKDTILKSLDQNGKITLPLEQGFGIGIKKGEKLNIVMDYAITDWSHFKMFDYANELKNNMRASVGFNYVPDKYVLGKGTYFKRTQYRAGAFYNSGYLDLNKTNVTTYGVSAGVSLPIGIRSGTGLMNLGVQYGVTGTKNNNLIQENFVRINFGFTFNSTYLEDLWFRKFKYD